MSEQDFPLWAAILVVTFLLIGSLVTLIGAIGLVTMRDFYERLHAPTLATSWGIGGILIASVIFFSVMQSRPVVHEILVTIFVVVTTPVTLMLVSRAAYHRDRTNDSKQLPKTVEKPLKQDE